jgi:hypothetical protein
MKLRSPAVIVYIPMGIQLNLSVFVHTPQGIQLHLFVIFHTPRGIQLQLEVYYKCVKFHKYSISGLE